MAKDTGNFLSFNKLWWHGDRVKEWLESGQCRPVTANIDMSLACNHSCPECLYKSFRTGNQHEAFYQMENVTKAIDHLAEAGIKGLLFTGGGEPLLNPNTPAAMEYAVSKGISTAIITNGEKINQTNAEMILRNADWIRISLDAATKAVYSKIHGNSDLHFGTILDNVRELVRLKLETGSSATIGLGMLTSADTIGEMVAFTGLADESGVDYCQFRPLLFPDAGCVSLHKKLFSGYLNECRELVKNKALRVVAPINKYELFLNDSQRTFRNCAAVNFALTVGSDANVYLCCHHRYKSKFLTSGLLDDNWYIQHIEKQKQIIKEIDIAGECPLLCKYDEVNEELNLIKNSIEHVNFV